MTYTVLSGTLNSSIPYHWLYVICTKLIKFLLLIAYVYCLHQECDNFIGVSLFVSCFVSLLLSSITQKLLDQFSGSLVERWNMAHGTNCRILVVIRITLCRGYRVTIR